MKNSLRYFKVHINITHVTYITYIYVQIFFYFFMYHEVNNCSELYILCTYFQILSNTRTESRRCGDSKYNNTRKWPVQARTQLWAVSSHWEQTKPKFIPLFYSLLSTNCTIYIYIYKIGPEYVPIYLIISWSRNNVNYF